MRILLPLLLIVIGMAIVFHSPEPEPEPILPLDFAKPIYTQDRAVVCPLSDLYDIRADHGQAALVDLFTITPPWQLKEKEAELECEEWIGGLQVQAVKLDMPSTLHWVQANGVALTLDLYLTNQTSK